jgi:hypothetical protein
MPAVGISIALAVDLALPLVLLVVIERINARNARYRGTRDFWIGVGFYAALLIFVAVQGLVSVLDYKGAGVAVAVFIALPLSLVPTIFNSFVIHHFFTVAQWAEFGYFVVLFIFVIGLVPWALLGPVLIRRIAQSGSGPVGYVPAPTP